MIAAHQKNKETERDDQEKKKEEKKQQDKQAYDTHIVNGQNTKQPKEKNVTNWVLTIINKRKLSHAHKVIFSLAHTQAHTHKVTAKERERVVLSISFSFSLDLRPTNSYVKHTLCTNKRTQRERQTDRHTHTAKFSHIRDGVKESDG